ncbi:MAG: hypothetical protein ACP5JB_06890 [candidate division WOR-3 bacterium]
MKNRWLYVLLAISLALNLTVFATFAWFRFQRFNRRVKLFRQLTRFEPRRIEPLLIEYHRQMDSLRLEYWRARQQLARLAFEENPDPQDVEHTLQNIGEIHQQMNRLVYETGRKTGMLLPPEHRGRIREGWCRMVRGPNPPPPPVPHRRLFRRR